jgi:ABC-type multidrug transport system ATPase subunit
VFLGFFAPPLTFTLGVFSTETYLYHHTNTEMDFTHTDLSKHLPNVDSCCGVLIVSALFYFFIAWGMPFDWIIPKEDLAEILGRMDDAVVYPCDGEEIDDDPNALLKVHDVTHIYADGTQAVKGITFSVRSGEVLSYLGANGAGKSTTMGMLCGTLPITYGDASVNGYSITRNKVLARRNLGICMQSDVIWDDISVIDHLYLFGRLRGMSGQELKDDVDRMIESLGFPEKAYSAAGTLSGGQKRRLCVGISMVGGNSVVYLDEPTAGLDPVSRRHLWELVQKNRHGRAILLTTHFMDEADVLGDRIAIVKEGRLRALGTSRFLKKRFGMGYLLRCSMESNSADNSTRRLQDCITSHIANASFVSNAGTEFAMRLPKDAVSSFPQLLEVLDTRKSELFLSNYGIETTTLEEVFMRIVNEDTESLISNPNEANRLLGASGEERDEESRRQQEQDEKRYPLSAQTVTLLLTPGRQLGSSPSGSRGGATGGAGKGGSSVLSSQIIVLFWKRFYQFVRSKGQWSMGVLVPAAMIAISGIIMEAIPDKLIYGSPDVTDTSYDTLFTTPIAGENEAVTEALAAASGVTDTTYIGSNYTGLYSYLEDQTTLGTVVSGASVYYAAANNATVLYNASFPIWYPGLISGVLQNALDQATGSLLTINVISQPLAAQALQEQANLAICFFFVACLIAGSLGAGISIVISGERVGLVKHQQL